MIHEIKKEMSVEPNVKEACLFVMLEKTIWDYGKTLSMRRVVKRILEKANVTSKVVLEEIESWYMDPKKDLDTEYWTHDDLRSIAFVFATHGLLKLNL